MSIIDTWKLVDIAKNNGSVDVAILFAHDKFYRIDGKLICNDSCEFEIIFNQTEKWMPQNKINVFDLRFILDFKHFPCGLFWTGKYNNTKFYVSHPMHVYRIIDRYTTND
jgi:hypothetical protein